MTTTLDAPRRALLSKVPEVTLWFWVIKILCTTVGESFADWINMTLGVGLVSTSLLFTAALVLVLGVQFRTRRYVPFVYWLTVVVISVTGTLYTDILTDSKGVPLKVSSAVFAALLVAVFGVWWAREGTLSIHSINTRPREAFYWLTVLVTFALGTATGDWTLDLTGWGPGTSVLLPATLIAVIAVCWRFGAQAVLSFWLAYVLTRPLGANIGDFLALPSSDKGLGLGTAGTSVVFLLAILATVVYLTVSKADVTTSESAARPGDPKRERRALGVFVVAALATAALLFHQSQQPHVSSLGEEGPSAPVTQLTPAEATRSFPAPDVMAFRTITRDALAAVSAGDQPGAATSATDLETAWDDREAILKPLDGTAWTFLGSEIDDVLTSVRAASPDPQTEGQALQALSDSLG